MSQQEAGNENETRSETPSGGHGGVWRRGGVCVRGSQGLLAGTGRFGSGMLAGVMSDTCM